MPSGIGTILQIALALVGAYVAAFWFCLVVWTFRDIQQRTRDVLVQLLATLLVLVFNVPGLILYVILRPPETLAEAYQRSLEEESLIQDIEERLGCPKCKSRVQPDFVLCPNCATMLKQPCVACGRLMHLNWHICPYCTTAADAMAPVPAPGHLAVSATRAVATTADVGQASA